MKKKGEGQWFNETYRMARRILSRVPPDGRHLVSFVDTVLEQESAWLSWKYQKRTKCRGIQKAKLSRKLDVDMEMNDEPPKKRQRQLNAPLMGSKQLEKLWRDRPKCFNPNETQYDGIKLKAGRNSGRGYAYRSSMGFPRQRPLVIPTSRNHGMDWLATRIQSPQERLKDALMKVERNVKSHISVCYGLAFFPLVFFLLF